MGRRTTVAKRDKSGKRLARPIKIKPHVEKIQCSIKLPLKMKAYKSIHKLSNKEGPPISLLSE